MLRLLGLLDSHHLPHKRRQRYTQKSEQQRQMALAKLLSYSDLGREAHPRKGILRREVSKHQETLPDESVASLGSKEGNITGRKNK